MTTNGLIQHLQKFGSWSLDFYDIYKMFSVGDLYKILNSSHIANSKSNNKKNNKKSHWHIPSLIVLEQFEKQEVVYLLNGLLNERVI